MVTFELILPTVQRKDSSAHGLKVSKKIPDMLGKNCHMLCNVLAWMHNLLEFTHII